MEFPTKLLKIWFLKNRRSLPWRLNPTPYRVWISEVMLQQTQVSTVIPYFERWMEVFPSIKSLAEAPLEKVLKLWEGLGYYSRARHLHAAAGYIIENFKGELPQDPVELAQIKGIGAYTQGAILGFAFRQKAAAVDGNVARVLSRYFAMTESIDERHAQKKLWDYANRLLPNKEPWLISEGLIELGATVCSKQKPKCDACPLKESCLAFSQSMQEKLPLRRARKEVTHLVRSVAVIHHEGKFLVRKEEKGKVMADLYEFPYLEGELSQEPNALETIFGEVLNLSLRYKQSLPEQRHTFTRFRARLWPHLFRALEPGRGYLWLEIGELNQLPFSSGHRKILEILNLK